MKLIYKGKGCEIWAQFDHTAEVYELFFDPEGESYTGWVTDTLAQARAAAKYIIEEQ
jgi:hypothetical protein